MMIRPIVKYGDPALQVPATGVAEVSAEIKTLVDDMVESMYAAGGVGLAAAQIGVLHRVFVADPSSGRRQDALVVMVNPKVVEREGVQTHPEGCLSIPGFEAPVARPARVVVTGLNRDGVPHTVEGTELLARVFQHEIDHLDGSLFLDRLRGIKREMIVRKARKLRRTGKW